MIALPVGFSPEGIAISGTTFYVGSIPTGAIYRGDLRTGKGSILVRAANGREAIGMKVDDRGRLFVAGGQTGKAFVYNAKTGALIRSFKLAPVVTFSDLPFLNDVVLTRDSAYFSDSLRPFVYRIPIRPNGTLDGHVQKIALGGPMVYSTGFNANGIAAVGNGRTLIVVQSNAGKLYRVDSKSGVTRPIDLGPEFVSSGDGLLLDGRTLYVVQSNANRIVVFALAANFASARVVARLKSPRLDRPTTIAQNGRRLYVVNARLGTPMPEAAEYQVIQLWKPRGR